MQALILDKSHQIIGTPDAPFFQFEVNANERPLEALHRALPEQLVHHMPAPWGQAWHATDKNRLRGLIFIVGPEWVEAISNAHPSWTRRKLAASLGDDAVWNLYCDGLLGGYRPPRRDLDVFQFGNTPSMASQLAHLVIKGRKRLTAGWVEATQRQGETIPSLGVVSIVTDGFGTPVCLIETVRVDIIPFRDIPHDVATEEGEGDLTFADWQAGHQRYFEYEAKEVNLTFTPDANIFVERFRLIKVFGG